MSRKLESIWDCSRMVMPEHKQRIIREEREQVQRVKPELDPQAIDEIEQAIAQSIENHSPITLTLYHPKCDKDIRGIVMSVDRQMRQIKVRWSEDDWDWIKLDDVISAAT
ncbi:YolD-like family protein [Paenibacillus wynnii]|uniref:YolD-like protein n=1 Tax=Paenibacillus wynnii TaxID=268407 RepID=A0A098M3S8_9BACL|nr:YolD-like family protein [Paenibacillus wynnii]KGE16242.1 hypothetical protein PWYN_15895 [Paenibacillus wynnii]